MRTLYHLPLDPDCRLIRLVLAEKGLTFELQFEKFWERRREFMKLNPAGDLPVLVEEDDLVINDTRNILAYLEETYALTPLLPREQKAKIEARRLLAWFDEKFAAEVSRNLSFEKVLKRFMGLGAANGEAIRAGVANLKNHLDYMSFLLDRRNWLAGQDLSLADLAAGAHISCLDYIGEVPWENFPTVKDWYARLKSRPSFRPLLAETMPTMTPAKHYANLDF